MWSTSRITPRRISKTSGVPAQYIVDWARTGSPTYAVVERR